MKKLSILIIFILSIFAFYLNYEKSTYHKVFSIESPTTLFIDENSNLIRDEKEPFVIENLYFLDRNKDYSKDETFKNIPADNIFIADYFAKETANINIYNKFIKISENDILVNNKSYRELLLKSGYFYDDSENSKKKLADKILSLNPDDYIVYNTRRTTYHKINCEHAKELRFYKILKKDSIPSNAKPCSVCILGKESKKKDYAKIPANNYTSPKVTNIKKSFTKGDITIFFLDINSKLPSAEKCNNEACSKLKREIDSAKSTIDFAVYGINNQPEIFNALVKARNRGVKIRWVTDHDKNEENYYKDTEKLKDIISDFNTDENYDLKNKSAIMHNKFFIFDEQKVWSGSANITGTDISEFNANFAILINSKEIAQIYTNEFNQMFSGKFHTDKVKQDEKTVFLNQTSINTYFSPQDNIITKQIIPLIDNAKEYIYIPVFFITKTSLIEPLRAAHNRGVDIRVINDATNSHTPHSIHKELRRAGIPVKTENYAGKMHMKALVIDDKISVIGSMNFTNSGEKRNDENVLIIQDEDIAKYIKNVFLYLWNKIPDKYLRFDPRAESLESIGSCSDGIDNNFDGETDTKDVGCFTH